MSSVRIHRGGTQINNANLTPGTIATDTEQDKQVFVVARLGTTIDDHVCVDHIHKQETVLDYNPTYEPGTSTIEAVYLTDLDDRFGDWLPGEVLMMYVPGEDNRSGNIDGSPVRVYSFPE